MKSAVVGVRVSDRCGYASNDRVVLLSRRLLPFPLLLLPILPLLFNVILLLRTQLTTRRIVDELGGVWVVS